MVTGEIDISKLVQIIRHEHTEEWEQDQRI